MTRTAVVFVVQQQGFIWFGGGVEVFIKPGRYIHFKGQG